MSNSERSLRAPEGEDSGLESESVEQTVNEDEEEKGVGRRVMIRVVSRQKFEPRDLLQSQSVSWGFRLGGNYGCLCCQADECGRDLSDAKQYHRRHKVCERHAKAAVVLVKSRRQRFCQQCSKFHELSEFDGTKRSCRDRLACHNKRRRKIPFPADQQAEHVPVQDAKLSRLMVTRHSK